MTPKELLRRLAADGPAPVYLFLGSEGYRRRICKGELIKRALPEAAWESGVTRFDLEETSLQEVIDDARSLSLFASERVIWVGSAEAALPRGRADADSQPGPAALKDYVKDPSPGVTLVFEASRFDLQGEGKQKAERVAKFYGAIPAAARVEFPPYTPEEALQLAEKLAKQAKIRAGGPELGLLVEAVGHDACRIATEIEKYRLYAGEGGEVTAALIASLTPSARASSIFELVAAMGRGNRKASLELLDTLVQEGEYLPLALGFLATQFRHALVVREMQLRGPREIEAHFKSMGVRIWFRKAQEIKQTADAFSAAELKSIVARIYQTDKALRDARPDDRVIMEDFLLRVQTRGALVRSSSR